MEQVQAIGEVLVDPGLDLTRRFRALFTLRNLGGRVLLYIFKSFKSFLVADYKLRVCVHVCFVSGAEAIMWISKAFTDDSVLLKHELAYCLGQMQDKQAIPTLIDVLKDTQQEPMVRHEAGKYAPHSVSVEEKTFTPVGYRTMCLKLVCQHKVLLNT